MISNEKKELKRALMGKTFPLEDGRLCVMTENDYRIPLGVSDGADSVLLLGIGRKAVYMKAAGKPGSAKKAAREAMYHVGRELILREQLDTIACIRKNRLTRPVVLTFLYVEDVPILTAWSARGLFSFISRRLAIRAFLKHCPKGLSLAAKKEEKEDRPEENQSKEKTKKEAIKKGDKK